MLSLSVSTHLNSLPLRGRWHEVPEGVALSASLITLKEIIGHRIIAFAMPLLQSASRPCSSLRLSVLFASRTAWLAFSPSEKTTKHDSEREPFGCVLTHEMILLI